jgi:hypothetical protein
MLSGPDIIVIVSMPSVCGLEYCKANLLKAILDEAPKYNKIGAKVKY